jgi:hypothetical protein
MKSFTAGNFGPTETALLRQHYEEQRARPTPARRPEGQPAQSKVPLMPQNKSVAFPTK